VLDENLERAVAPPGDRRNVLADDASSALIESRRLYSLARVGLGKEHVNTRAREHVANGERALRRPTVGVRLEERLGGRGA